MNRASIRLLLTLALTLLPCLPLHAKEAGITLVAEDDWYPYSAVKRGQLNGLSVDLVRAAYAAVGVPLQLKYMPFARCIALVERGEELGCFNSGQDPKMDAESYLFHQTPLLHNANGIYALAGSRLSKLGPADLSTHRVGLTHGYSYGDAVESNKRIVRDIAMSDIASLRKLLLGRIDFALVDPRVVAYLLNAHPEELGGKLQLVGYSLERSPVYVVFSRRHADAVRSASLLDRGLAALKASGEYKRIIERWASPPP